MFTALPMLQDLLKSQATKMKYAGGAYGDYEEMSITLIMPSGKMYALTDDNFSFVSHAFMKAICDDDIYFARYRMPAFRAGSQGPPVGQDQEKSAYGLLGMDREAGLGGLRHDLRLAHQQVRKSAPSGLGADSWPNSQGEFRDTPSVRQSLLRKSGASGEWYADRQLQGRFRATAIQGRGLGAASQSQAHAGAGGKHQSQPESRGDLRQSGAGIRGGAGSDFPYLHRESLATFLYKALGPGERWITLKPHGHDEKGVPVLIKETTQGSGVYHVIGGAGGKLNYMRIRPKAPDETLKDSIAARRKAKQEQKKVQAKRDKELGLDQAKKGAKEQIQLKEQAEERTFINTVAQAMNWQAADLEPKIPDHLSDKAQERLRQQHHADLLKRAHEAVDLQRQHLATDAEARATALEATDLAAAALDDTAPAAKKGLGFAAQYAERAQAQGLSDEELQREAEARKEERRQNLSDGQREAIRKRGDASKALKAEIDTLREPVLSAQVKASLAEAKQGAELIKAQVKLQEVKKQARAVRQDIDRATEVKAWNLDVAKAEEHLDDQVRAAVENDVRTLSTRAFLGKVQAAAGGDAAVQLRQHVSAGAFNSINALAITAGGAALVDRSVVDVLGVAGAAQVLARRLHADLPAADVERLTEGLTAFHQAHYLEAGSEGLREADSLLDAAKEAELGEAHYGDEFAALQQLNQRRKDAVEAANQILATRLGEFEANAALEVALKAGRRDEPLEVPLGGLSDEDAIRQARAIGLQRGDYQLNKVAGQQVLTVTPAGLDRLAQPVDSAELTRLQRTLDIIEGRHDEPDWLPAGFAKRPDLALEVPPGVAPSLAQRFDPAGAGGDLTQACKDYIGGRAADGDSPADILADLHSADFVRKAGDAAGYQAALDAVAPLKDAQGKLRRAEDLTPAFEALADDYVQRRFGDRLAPVHRQSFALDQTAAEALHRALAQEPAGTAAYKAIGDLTGDDQRTLREWFYQQVAKESPEAGALRQRLEALEQAEPDKESVDMFGDRVTNPEWQAWQGQRDTLAAEVGQASLNWNDYTQMLHGHVNAYAAIQDLIRSDTSRAFADAYNRLNPAAPLKLGRQTIRNNLNHLDAVDPEARTARLAQTRELIDRLRERNQGRYAEGAVSDKLDEARARQEALAQSQMGFFSSEESADGNLFGVAGGGDLFGAQADMFGAAPAQPASQPLKADERHTLGQVAERQIAALMPTVGGQFKSGRPVKLYQPTMSGTVDSPEAMRQRAIKLVAENKRLALAAGTGAGKTAMSLGAFTHLQAQGKAQRGLFLVPSIVQGEFNAEALRFLDPGRFNWHAEPGASREERIAAYKDPAHHFAVMTHQSFRDDMLHLGAQHAGIEPGAMSEQLAAMSPPARADWLKGVMAKEGIRFDFLGVDEGHNTLNRKGKENSAMANVVDALAHQTPYYLHSTADPIKNDLSEAFDLLRKMDPTRYADQAAFLRRYGPDTAGAKQALQREMARYVLPFKIDPPVRADKREIRVDLSDGQRQALADLDKHLAKASLARKQGQVDVAALQALSPESFAGVPADQHEAVARDLSTSLGILKGTATRRIVDAHPESGKLGTVTRLAKERPGQPGVVFAHSLAAVERLKQALEADGHRVVTITGADSAEDKATKIKAFNPEQGERSADIVVASDAGATGANLQSGQWLVQFDTPLTAMGHAQRQGRINRIGQKNNVELLDLVANHPSEDRARARLKTKYALREMLTTPLAGLDDTGLAAFLHQRRVAEGQASLF